MAFAGGREFTIPNGSIVRSSNITPDKETGIGNWSQQEFVQRFKAFADSAYVTQGLKSGEFNTIMPWTMYCNMTEQDLAAIYTYLQTVSPIKNAVVKFQPAGTSIN